MRWWAGFLFPFFSLGPNITFPESRFGKETRRRRPRKRCWRWWAVFAFSFWILLQACNQASAAVFLLHGKPNVPTQARSISLCLFFLFFLFFCFGSSCKPVIVVASAAVLFSTGTSFIHKQALCVCLFLLRSCCKPVIIASGAIFFSRGTEHTYTRKLSLCLFFLFSFWSLLQGSSSSSINSTFFYTGTDIRYASKLTSPFSLSFSFARNLTLLLCLPYCSWRQADWRGAGYFCLCVKIFFLFSLFLGLVRERKKNIPTRQPSRRWCPTTIKRLWLRNRMISIRRYEILYFFSLCILLSFSFYSFLPPILLLFCEIEIFRGC